MQLLYGFTLCQYNYSELSNILSFDLIDKIKLLNVAL